MSGNFEFTASHAPDGRAQRSAHQEPPFSDPEETRVLYATLDSFRQYRQAAHYNVTHLRRQSFYSLRSGHVDLLSEKPFSLPEAFDQVDSAIDSNADLCEAILETGLASFGIHSSNLAWKGCATPSDMDKARSTIRQLFRDWTTAGRSERDAAYGPIIAAVERHLPAIPTSKRHRQSILVPGAGLGRLIFELCSSGYSVEGNEISYHQLLASNYILNCTQKAEQHVMYPWALNFSNHLKRENQLRSYGVPDIHPATSLDISSETIKADVPYSERMSMMAGDFCVLYQQPEYQNTFDAVTTCFFIDTAPNVINYIETIKNCLKPGGMWINLGPLLWHFEQTATPAEKARSHQTSGSEQQTSDQSEADKNPLMSEGIGEPGKFELTDDEVISLVSHLGFEFVEHEQTPASATGYIQDPASMLQNLYRPSFWVARKQ